MSRQYDDPTPYEAWIERLEQDAKWKQDIEAHITALEDQLNVEKTAERFLLTKKHRVGP